MPDYLRCLIAFQRRLHDDRAWALEIKAWTFECDKCAKQTSVTSGTTIHGSKSALHIWFWTAFHPLLGIEMRGKSITYKMLFSPNPAG